MSASRRQSMHIIKYNKTLFKNDCTRAKIVNEQINEYTQHMIVI